MQALRPPDQQPDGKADQGDRNDHRERNDDEAVGHRRRSKGEAWKTNFPAKNIFEYKRHDSQHEVTVLRSEGHNNFSQLGIGFHVLESFDDLI